MKIDMLKARNFKSVSIFLFGDNLDPPVVAEVLGVRPRKSWRKGERTSTRKDASRRKTGGFAFVIDGEDSDLSKLMDALLIAIPMTEDLRELVPGVERVRVAVFSSSIVEAGQANSESFNFSSRHLELLSRSGAELGIDCSSGPEG